jgi:prevent-host-death family protein
MTMIGIRELKAHLSAYLKRVKKGEAIAVSERGKEIARLTPSGKPRGRSGLWELARRGIVEWSGGRPKGLTPRIKIKGKPLSQTVIENREDRV